MLFAIWAGLIFICSVLPLLPISHGIARSFDFPRIQIAIAAAVTLLLAIPVGGVQVATVIASVLCLAAIALHLPWIVPYTKLWPTQSIDAPPTARENTTSTRFLIANVLQSNIQYRRLVEQIEQLAPDIVVLMEVDDQWQEALLELSKTYPHRQGVYQSNLYGMVLWSRLPWKQAEVRFVVQEGIPSIAAHMLAPNGTEFMLYAVHPEPPDPASDTSERDAEIVMIGLEAQQHRLPAIVTGDLNDVAWSRTTQRFLRLSGLVDPRIGRGMYNTFHAKYPFLRWPLDQLFHDSRIMLRSIRRLPPIGSDHFPVLFELILTDDAEPQRTPNGSADEVDRQEARELLDTAGVDTGRLALPH